MEKKELLQTLADKRIYATDEPMMHWVEFTGEYAGFHNAMHSFLMKGLASEEVTCDFVGKLSDTEYAELKVLEIPMTLTVLTGGEQPAYTYTMDGDLVSRNQVLDGIVIEEALLNMEDTGRYVWDILHGYFGQFGIELGAVELTFGHLAEHFIVMCGDLTPNTMCLIDPDTGKRLWNGEDGVENAYEVILARMGG